RGRAKALAARVIKSDAAVALRHGGRDALAVRSIEAGLLLRARADDRYQDDDDGDQEEPNWFEGGRYSHCCYLIHARQAGASRRPFRRFSSSYCRWQLLIKV